MTIEEMQKIFAENNDAHYLEFPSIKRKRSSRPDLHAFLLLNELQPSNFDIVDCAEHDEIWLGVDVEKLAKIITKDQIIELAQCGVLLDDNGSLSMFA